MTKISSVFGLLLLVSLACLVKSDGIAPALITVSGTGESKGQPDEVVVTVGIQVRNDSVQAVSSETDTVSSSVIAYLKSQGVEDADIQTSYVTLSPYYSYTGSEAGQTTPDYYTSQKSVTFSLKDLSAYDDIMTALYALGINSVNSVSFKIEDVTARQQEARKLAVANAKKIANTLTSGLGAKVGGVYSVSEYTTDGSNQTPIFFYAAKSLAAGASADGNSGPSIAGGQVTITSTVTVSFYIIN